jgi:hypothetical protein
MLFATDGYERRWVSFLPPEGLAKALAFGVLESANWSLLETHDVVDRRSNIV